MKHKTFFSVALATLAIAAISIAFVTHTTSAMTPTNGYKPPITGTNLDKYTSHPKRHLVIVTKQGTIKCQMFEKVAPNHVANFMDLAKTHFYDSTYFHRCIPGFMIQGGDPNTKDNDYTNDGSGNGPRRINAEFNEIHHARGILSTARTQDPNSASCQFFIMHGDAGFLDRQYTVWGQVIEGMDVVDKIMALPDVTNRPKAQIDQQGPNPGKAAEILKMYVEGE
ncbi:MAG: peptidylprolyl isomerase [Bacteroidota bacterium]|nr:peptidylprolyl isomerase [Bacteroidota bacterium]MDP4234135.1 peptidylprolyl isomerase [Bacteroidota bacterium]MDP4244072.1 peptidylprolyl isomerase [Bacteroidota bacterium]MDP4289226.1 peptidylprolyl isomerase [Bacteroidota bacterium]